MSDSQKRQALRVLVAPDSFKGSLEAAEVAARIASGIRAAIPESLVTEAPIADGGEGTASAIARGLGGTWHHVAVLDANRNSIQLPFAVCKSAELGAFAVFDVAEIIGLPDAVLPPGTRTTRGIGQAIRAIAKQGFKTIALGLGGSSTNDGGAGMLAELAFEFLDATGAAIDPVFDNLAQVHSIEWRVDSGWLTDIRLIGLTDVTSPLAGPTGASMIFGGQKGFRDLEQADAVLAQFGKQCSAMLGRDLSCIEGAGAAGGLGFAVCALGGTLQPGASFILDALQLRHEANNFDWVITGEGRSDRQTLLGKGPAIVAQLARQAGIPVTLLSGAIDLDPALDAAFDGCFSIQPGPVSLGYAMNHAGELLERAGKQVAALFAKAMQGKIPDALNQAKACLAASSGDKPS